LNLFQWLSLFQWLKPYHMALLNGPIDRLPKDLLEPILCCNPMARYAARLIIP
jgi:hypothetical protein